MKSNEVMKMLNISRSTLYLYVRDGKITGTKLPNGQYDYHEDSVFKFMKKDTRLSVIYARVSTYKQSKDLDCQILKLQTYCSTNNILISNVYKDVSSGLDFERKDFSSLLDDVIKYKIKDIYITHPDRLTRLSFKTIRELFSKFGTNIISIDNQFSKDNDSEVFEELNSLMRVFSTTMYSNQKINKVNIFKEDIQNFITSDK